MSEEIIKLTGLTRAYGNDRPAVDGVDLSVISGESLSIVGRSGSGKSTLLNLIGLLDTPDAGEYELLGVPLSSRGEADRSAFRAHYFGFVFQAFHLINHRTVLENIELGAMYAGWSRRRRRAKAEALASQLGIEHRAYALPNTLR